MYSRERAELSSASLTENTEKIGDMHWHALKLGLPQSMDMGCKDFRSFRSLRLRTEPCSASLTEKTEKREDMHWHALACELPQSTDMDWRDFHSFRSLPDLNLYEIGLYKNRDGMYWDSRFSFCL
jgi:hypothetical protein